MSGIGVSVSSDGTVGSPDNGACIPDALIVPSEILSSGRPSASAFTSLVTLMLGPDPGSGTGSGTDSGPGAGTCSGTGSSASTSRIASKSSV